MCNGISRSLRTLASVDPIVPRAPRHHLPEGIYHVTSRGVAGAPIFADDIDRQAFVLLLQQVSALCGWKIQAWCLMGTHYHLLVDSSREQMSRALHRLNGMYAQRFNRRHARRGHLFENRFSAWVIRDEAHLSATVAYILENPVRAGLCSDSRDWMWNGRHVPRRLPLPRPVRADAATTQGLSLGHGRGGHEDGAGRG